MASLLITRSTQVLFHQHTCLRPWLLSPRLFSTSPIRRSQSSATLLNAPTPEYLQQEEIEVDLPQPSLIQLLITEKTAQQLRSISEREGNPEAALRIAVESGGCHGYQYKMDLEKQISPGDYHFAHPSIQPSNVIVDPISLSLINGSTIDFATELIGSSFVVADNPQSKGKGCGCGVSWELKT